MKEAVKFIIYNGGCKINTEFRSSHQRCSIKKAVLENLSIFTGKHLNRDSSRGEYCKIFKNTYFEEQQNATSVNFEMEILFKLHFIFEGEIFINYIN